MATDSQAELIPPKNKSEVSNPKEQPALLLPPEVNEDVFIHLENFKQPAFDFLLRSSEFYTIQRQLLDDPKNNAPWLTTVHIGTHNYRLVRAPLKLSTEQIIEAVNPYLKESMSDDLINTLEEMNDQADRYFDFRSEDLSSNAPVVEIREIAKDFISHYTVHLVQEKVAGDENTVAFIAYHQTHDESKPTEMIQTLKSFSWRSMFEQPYKGVPAGSHVSFNLVRWPSGSQRFSVVITKDRLSKGFRGEITYPERGLPQVRINSADIDIDMGSDRGEIIPEETLYELGNMYLQSILNKNIDFQAKVLSKKELREELNQRMAKMLDLP